MKVVVVGAGVGGLAVSIRLAAAGHEVSVLERNPMVGGKMATLVEEGFTFDLGPTVLTLPGRFDDLFRVAGTTLADEVELTRLDPQVRYRWPDGSMLDVSDGPARWFDDLEAFSPGASGQWRRFDERARSVWDASERTFLAGPAGRSPFGVGRVDGNRTLAKAAAASFDDPRLQQLIGRYATYSGSSPYQVPATVAGLAHVERAYGCWHVMGGLGRLRDALADVAARLGVDIRTGADVGSIAVVSERVAGVELADGGTEQADVVVTDVDSAHLFVDLLPSPRIARKLDKVERSASAFVICAAVRGRTEGIAHHNVWFSLDERREFTSLEAGQMPIDPTIHACVSSVTDASQAPEGCENWRIAVATPPATGVDRRYMTAAILNRLAERGVDLRTRIDFTRTLVPADFDARYRAPGGSIHGTSSNGRRAAFQRPANEGPVDGLYLVGGSSHPGGGLPLIASGARIVADLVAERHG